MKCQNCSSHLGGMFQDSYGYFKINLCGDCAVELGYHVNNLQNSRKCFQCGQYFIPSKSWAKICIPCWIKTKPNKKPFVPKLKVQRKLLEVVELRW